MTGTEFAKTVDLVALLAEAKVAGQKAVDEYWVKTMKKQDMDACGFVWLEVPAKWAGRVLGPKLIALGCYKANRYGTTVYCYGRFGFTLNSQGMCLEEAGYKAARDVLRKAGFGDNISMGSRMD